MGAQEVDRLEIAIESEASSAVRSMSRLEKNIDKVTESLERCMLVAQGAISFKGINIDNLFSSRAVEKSAKTLGKKAADDLIKNFNLNLAGADVEKQVRNLTRKITKGLSANQGKPYKGFSDDIEELGRLTAKNGQIARSTSEEYQNLYNWIKKTGKIKISPETAKSLGDDYKNRTPLAKQKISTNGGTELDSIYQELRDQFPTILKEAYSVEDEFYQLENALKEFYKTSDSFYKPEWMEEDAYDSVINAIGDISNGIKTAQDDVGRFGESIKGIEDTGKSFAEMFGANMDTSGLERAERILGSIGRSGRTDSQKKTRSDLKYPTATFSDISKKFKDSRLETDFSSMTSKQLESEIAKNERSYNRVRQAISDMMTLEGTDELGGKDWYNKIMQMNQYENAINDATEALGKLQAADSLSKYKNATAKNDAGGYYEQKSSEVYPESMNYNAEAMKAVFGDGAEKLRNFNDVMAATGKSAGLAGQAINDFNGSFSANKVNTYEAQIKSLKKELDDLASQGFTQGDSEYDYIASKLAEATEAKRRYDKEMRNKAKAGLDAEKVGQTTQAMKDASKQAGIFRKVLNGFAGAGSKINSISKSFEKLSKTIKNSKDIAQKAIHPFRTLKNLISGNDSGNKNNGMSFGRMIGSSIMFSTIFGAISQIKSAVKEGSDNLVQYSSSYNKSISGMVSSLLYLKNAWAAAFAPIINVVGPYISQFIDMVASALNAVGQFMGALTGKGYTVQAKKAWKDYGASIADASNKTDKANESAKKLQKTILGFDELNVLTSNDTTSNSGSGNGSSGKYEGPSPSDMFETVEVPNSMNQLADKFKEAIKNSDFTEIGQMVGDKLKAAMESIPWNDIYHKADNFGKDLATFLNGLISPELFYDLGATIAGCINTALHSLNSFATNFDWSNFGASLASSIKGFFANWDAGLTGETFSNFVTGMLESMKAFLDTLQDDKVFEDIGQKIVDFICGIDWMKITWDLGGLMLSLARAIVNLPNDLLRGAMKSMLKHTTNMSDEEIEMKLPKFVLPPLSGLGLFALGQQIISGVLEGIQKGEWKNPFKFIKDRIFDPFIKWFKSLFGIHSPSTVMEEQGGYIMSGLLNGVTNKLQEILDFFVGLKDSIVEKFTDFKDKLGEKFSEARTAVEEKFSDIGEWFSGKKEDIQGKLGDVGDWFKDKFGSARESVNKKFSDVGSWFSDRKTDIQNKMKDIGDWFGSKFSSGRKNVNTSFQDVGAWFGSRKSDIQSNTKDIDSWMLSKYNSARTNVNSKFNDIGTWFGNRKTDVQTNMNSIDSWFLTKYQDARGYVNSVFQNVGDWFGSRRNDIQNNMSAIVSWFRDTFQKAYNSITGIFSSIGSYFSGIANAIKTPIRSALNGVIGGVNWVLSKLGSNKQFDYVQFASGTGSGGVPQDTLGMVNDQAGATYREMVQFPNGKTVIPEGRNVMMHMPKGTKVLPAGKTKALMQAQGVPHFKNGVGDFFGGVWGKVKDFTGDVFDYITNPGKLVQIAIDKFTNTDGWTGIYQDMAKGAISTVLDSATAFVKKVFDTSSVASVERAVKWAIGIANDNRHGYDQSSRWGNPDYDCSALVISAFEQAGIKLKSNGAWTTSNMYPAALKTGFKDITGSVSRASGGGLRSGDILLRRGHHTALYIGNGQVVQASQNEFGGITGGKPGDQTGREIWVGPYYNFPWSDVLRYGKGYKNGGMPVNGEVYVANERGFGSEYIGKMGNRHVVANNQQITEGIKQAVIDGMMEVYMATQTSSGSDDKSIPYIINAVLKTEDNEILARAVEKGQASRSSRFNPSPAY